MERDIAKAIAQIAADCSTKTERSVKAVNDSCDEAVSKQYKMLAGSIMGYLFADILGPIWTEHEDIAPEWFREQSKTKPKKAVIDKGARESIVSLMNEIEEAVSMAAELAETSQDADAVARVRDAVDEIVGYVDAIRHYVHTLDVAP